MANIKQSTLIQKRGNVENHFIISGSDLADVVEAALSKIREKSRSAYAEDMQDKLARGKEVFIDKHSGSGTYYTVIWENTAQLLVISHSNTLSTQLLKLTGDTWSLQDFEEMQDKEVIRHKATGKYFIVLSQVYYENYNKEALADLLSYYKFAYNFSTINQ